MKNYWKLTNFEFERFAKGYGVLLILTILSQITAVFLTARKYMDATKELVFVQRMSEADALEELGSLSMMNITRTSLFNAPIALCIAGLLLYCVFIWYRDWLGKNTFIYRLLMLPTNRISLFLSKLSVIMMAVCGLVGTQILLLLFESQLLKWLVPTTYRIDMTLFEITDFSQLLSMLIPGSFTQFLIHYGIGLLAVIVLFTGILMERSFRFKGLAMGMIYGFASFFLLFLPMFLEVRAQRELFYPSEMFLLILGIGFVLAGISIALSHYLLQKKVTV